MSLIEYYVHITYSLNYIGKLIIYNNINCKMYYQYNLLIWRTKFLTLVIWKIKKSALIKLFDI